MIRRLVICVLLFGSIEQNPAFSQELITQTYNAQDGLSSSSVYSFYHDRLGYFWISTLQGLDRWDGTTFKKYGLKHGLPSVMCNVFFEDAHNRFWVGTRMGIAELKKDSFYVYPTTDHKQLGYVFQLFENRQGHLIANTSQGQYKFISGKWMPENNSNLGKAEIIKINNGDYYTSNLGLFHQQDGGTVQRLFPVQNQKGPLIYALNFKKDVPYLTTGSSFYKFAVEAQSGMLRPVKEFTFELNGKHLRSTKLDTQGRWWFSTEEDGVLMLEDKQGHIIQNKIPFSFNYVALFYEDRNGQMWITSPSGALKVSQTLYSSMVIREVTKGNHIMNFIPLKKNQLMLSINDGRLLHIEYTLDAIPSYKVMDVHQMDGGKDFIDHYDFDSSGELWFSTRESNLYHLHHGVLVNKTNLCTDIGEDYILDLAFHPVTGELILATDSLLVAGDASGVDTLFDEYHRFITDPRQIDFMEGDQLVIRNSKGKLILYGKNKENKRELLAPGSDGIESFEIDKQQHLWTITSQKGMYGYTSSASLGVTLKDVIDEPGDNIPMNISQYNFDQSGALWSINSHGLQRIQADQGKWSSSEYFINEISNAAFLDWFKPKEIDNHIWINLENQMIFFDQNLPAPVQESPTVILEDVQLNNQITNWKNITDSVTTYFEIPHHPHLKYYQNTLTFYFNNPTTLQDQGTTFSYRLLPDTAWNRPTTNKSVSFSKLLPSTYSFEVRSRNIGTPWSTITSFPFSIQKPFWDTLIFRIIIIALGTFLVTWLVRFRIQQEKKKGEMKHQLLELEMRALRSQMNPHFIYNALNSIQSLVATQQSKLAGKYISIFGRLLRQVLENSKYNVIPLNRELETLHHYIDLEKLRLDSDVTYEEWIDPDLVPESIRIPPLILQPFVENALWHGLSTKEGEKKITIHITVANGFVLFSITDNGIGRQQSSQQKSTHAQHESFGIQVTTQRIDDFNGNGTDSQFHITDLQDTARQSAGTQVSFRIKYNTDPGSNI